MNRFVRQVLPFASLIILILFLTIKEYDKFLTWSNFMNVFRRSSVNGIIAVGMLCGILNGTLITKAKLAPFIVTLGTMSVFRGISYVMNDGQPYNVHDYRWLGEGLVLGIPISILIFVAVVAAAETINDCFTGPRLLVLRYF